MAKILVADDHINTLAIAEQMLMGPEHEVITTTQGDQVQSLVAEMSPDLLIIDIFMPGTDGIENIRVIRKIHPELPIIAISTYEDYLVVAKKLGATDAVGKPLLGSDLLDRVSELI